MKRRPHFFTVDNVQNGLESCPPEIVQKSEWFNDWGRPNDMFHSFGGTLQREGSLACFITAMRPRTSDPFADEQLDLLRLLMPHLKRALELQQRLARLAASETGLDFFPTGVFVVDGHATPRYWNRAAQQILDSRNGLYVLGGHLQAASGEPNKQLRALLNGALHKSLHCQPGEPLQIPRLDKRPLILQAFPLPSAVPVFQGWLPGALLFVTDPDNLPEPQANLVAKLFHLTPAESEVAVALAAGRSIDEISNELSISRNTARCHVQKIFQKTGVSRQGQLIRLLMQSGVVDIRR